MQWCTALYIYILISFSFYHSLVHSSFECTLQRWWVRWASSPVKRHHKENVTWVCFGTITGWHEGAMYTWVKSASTTCYIQACAFLSFPLLNFQQWKQAYLFMKGIMTTLTQNPRHPLKTSGSSPHRSPPLIPIKWPAPGHTPGHLDVPWLPCNQAQTQLVSIIQPPASLRSPQPSVDLIII